MHVKQIIILFIISATVFAVLQRLNMLQSRIGGVAHEEYGGLIDFVSDIPFHS